MVDIGYVGDECQFSDELNCRGNGNVHIDIVNSEVTRATSVNSATRSPTRSHEGSSSSEDSDDDDTAAIVVIVAMVLLLALGAYCVWFAPSLRDASDDATHPSVTKPLEG